MSIETVLYNRLKTYPGLTAIISARVYAVIAPDEATKPYVTYQKISPGRDYSHSGYSGLQKPRIQVSSYALTYEEAEAIDTQVTAALESWVGQDTVQAVFKDGEREGYERDNELYYRSSDFFVANGKS